MMMIMICSQAGHPTSPPNAISSSLLSPGRVHVFGTSSAGSCECIVLLLLPLSVSIYLPVCVLLSDLRFLINARLLKRTSSERFTAQNTYTRPHTPAWTMHPHPHTTTTPIAHHNHGTEEDGDRHKARAGAQYEIPAAKS